jgi:hypothetical protein
MNALATLMFKVYKPSSEIVHKEKKEGRGKRRGKEVNI